MESSSAAEHPGCPRHHCHRSTLPAVLTSGALSQSALNDVREQQRMKKTQDTSIAIATAALHL